MTLVLGVDGCPGGWCCVAIDAGTGRIIESCVIPFFEYVLESPAAVICADIPIGLLDVPGQRACDSEARRRLGRTSLQRLPAAIALLFVVRQLSDRK